VKLISAACVAWIAIYSISGHAQMQQVSLQVELDIFSGRPNPVWELTAPQATEFMARFQMLQSIEKPPSGANGLGYRGFVVRPAAGVLNGFDEVRVYRGVAVAREGNRAKAFTDPERVLERQLLSSSRDHIPEPILQDLEREIMR